MERLKRITALQKILVGLGSLVIIGIFGTVIFTILYLALNTPRESKLSSNTVWELMYILADRQHLRPADIIPPPPWGPPVISFGPGNNFEGNDGCNGFQGYFLDKGNGNLNLDPIEHTLLACGIIQSGHQIPIAGDRKFEHTLSNTVRYELISGELDLFLGGSSDIMVFEPSNKSKSFDYLGPYIMPKWECQSLPYLYFFLGGRCWYH
jgi:heat shock protein HslJ